MSRSDDLIDKAMESAEAMAQGGASYLLTERLDSVMSHDIIFMEMDPRWVATLVERHYASLERQIKGGILLSNFQITALMGQCFQMGHDYALEYGDIRNGADV